MIPLLIAILFIAVVGWAAFWIIAQIGAPPPVALILRVLVGIILLVALLDRAGLGGSLRL